MSITMPETTDSYGNLSLTVITAKPTDLAAITKTTDLATANAENVTCHAVGDWLPTASTDKVARQRKMCQTKTTNALGTSTWDTPTLMYTYNPQAVGTVGADGNEAYEALPEGAERYLVLRLGGTGTDPLDTGDEYYIYPVKLGPQVPATSSEDAGGEFVINQDMAFISGYDGPVQGAVVAGT